MITARTKNVPWYKFGLWAFPWCAGIFAKGDVNKKRLCVQYEMTDYNSSMIPLKKMSGMTRSSCFVECVRHQQGRSPCRAFHFRQLEGICELLPKDITCMADNTTPGTTYVHLSDCGSVAPWSRINPEPGPLQWVTNRDRFGTLGMLSPLGGYRLVVRVLHKGLWLPGHATHKAYVTLPNGIRIACRSYIQYINSSKPTPYLWVPFSVGHPVPASAIVAGYWPNGTPLYIIYRVAINERTLVPGYFNANSLQIRPAGNFRSDRTGILVSRE